MTSACIECATRARVIAQLSGLIQKRANTDHYPLTGMLRLEQGELFRALGVPAGRAISEVRRARTAAERDIAPRDDGGSVCHHDVDNYPARLRDLGRELPHALFFTGPVER